MKISNFVLSAAMALLMFMAISCEKDEDENNIEKTSEFVSVEAPYLICAGRNPGGVGFDFQYNGEKGGANNMDSLSVIDFQYDLKIRTIKGENGDGTLGGAPFIQLNTKSEAVNYSSVDATCKGLIKFNALSSANVASYTLATDDAAFNIASVTKGETGAPMMEGLQSEYAKLVIGEAWKAAAKNDILEDEPIWIVKTREGKLVKFIVVDFPAKPAPTASGYVAITWDYLN
ncbi:MAG: hypothetical protein JEZ09_13370 [Salinivirgaceae bacterium]|nr:hypothetical protein [Salinivirgaceae bacterium]